MPHTAVNDTRRLRGPPSAYSRAPNLCFNHSTDRPIVLSPSHQSQSTEENSKYTRRPEKIHWCSTRVRPLGSSRTTVHIFDSDSGLWTRTGWIRLYHRKSSTGPSHVLIHQLEVDTHYTRTYGPYVWVSKNAPVHTGRKYGPYVRAVCTGTAYRPWERRQTLYINSRTPLPSAVSV